MSANYAKIRTLIEQYSNKDYYDLTAEKIVRAIYVACDPEFHKELAWDDEIPKAGNICGPAVAFAYALRNKPWAESPEASAVRSWAAASGLLKNE